MGDVFVAGVQPDGSPGALITRGGPEDDGAWAVDTGTGRVYVAGRRTEGGRLRAWLMGFSAP